MGREDRAEADAALASHWLRGAGRVELTAALDLREWPAVAGRALVRRAALPAYIAVLLGATALLVAWLLATPAAAQAGWIALAALLMCFPASEAVVAVAHRLVSESARPSHLPRLSWPGGIPAAHRVMVVIPVLLTDAELVHAVVHRLLLHALANPEREAQFALLSDWADADAAHLDSDADLLDLARRQITALNARYVIAAAQAPRFLLLHRERRFSETEQRWIGWERKRGKLEQLVTLLATGEHGAFVDLGDLSRPAAGTHYIVTLDSDTQLPPGRLRDLVAVAAHPQNRPRLDASGRSVTSGYGILQPHLVTTLPAEHEATRFHALFGGQCGVDPYSAASSEV
jgi:cyclic beta-1,2-glucan synthetase